MAVAGRGIDHTLLVPRRDCFKTTGTDPSHTPGALAARPQYSVSRFSSVAGIAAALDPRISPRMEVAVIGKRMIVVVVVVVVVA